MRKSSSLSEDFERNSAQLTPDFPRSPRAPRTSPQFFSSAHDLESRDSAVDSSQLRVSSDHLRCGSWCCPSSMAWQMTYYVERAHLCRSRAASVIRFHYTSLQLIHNFFSLSPLTQAESILNLTISRSSLSHSHETKKSINLTSLYFTRNRLFTDYSAISADKRDGCLWYNAIHT